MLPPDGWKLEHRLYDPASRRARWPVQPCSEPRCIGVRAIDGPQNSALQLTSGAARMDAVRS
jgi:hypothetical protein